MEMFQNREEYSIGGADCGRGVIFTRMSLYISYDAFLSGDQSGQLGSVGIRYRW
ncbi:MAG: hypothetical protein GXX82_13730 [Syntrophorhabdus sp.]|nr:hypothetical protein [Syntrophorhabdus sp.]